jgi:hypothetical protein
MEESMSARNGTRNFFENYVDQDSECIDLTPEHEKLPPEYQEHLDKWWEILDKEMEERREF